MASSWRPAATGSRTYGRGSILPGKTTFCLRPSASYPTTCTAPSVSPAPTRRVSVRRRPRSARVPDFATLTPRPAAAPPGIKMHTRPMTMPHKHRRRTEVFAGDAPADDAAGNVGGNSGGDAQPPQPHGHKHNSECQKIEEKEC